MPQIWEAWRDEGVEELQKLEILGCWRRERIENLLMMTLETWKC